MKTAFGLIFSNIHDNNIPELTRRRTIASVPFGGRYRLIDFALSNMVNSDIFNVGVITHYNYRSLMDHVGTGKDWDLARRNAGLKFLPPFITAFDGNKGEMKPYSTRLEALMGVSQFISHCKEEFVVLTDCDCAINIDLKAVIDDHVKNNADITMVVKDVVLNENEAKKHTVVVAERSGKIKEILDNPTGVSGKHTILLNITVISRLYLYNLLQDAISHGYTNFNVDIIAKNSFGSNYRVYKYDGYYTNIDSLSGYLACNLDLLNSQTRDGLFNIKNRPILTKVRNSAPSKYHDGCSVQNSLIADGCEIKGTVINSVLFRGVSVGKGTVVKNSVIMQDALIGDNVNLNCVILDKNAVILNSRNLSGYETMPFFVDKGMKI